MIRFPFTDFGGEKLRPAVLVTDTSVVRGPDGHFVYVGSQEPPPDVTAIPVTEDSEEALKMGLKFSPGAPTQYVYPRKIMTLEVSLVARKIGSTPPSLLEKITQEIGRAVGVI